MLVNSKAGWNLGVSGLFKNIWPQPSPLLQREPNLHLLERSVEELASVLNTGSVIDNNVSILEIMYLTSE